MIIVSIMQLQHKYHDHGGGDCDGDGTHDGDGYGDGHGDGNAESCGNGHGDGRSNDNGNSRGRGEGNCFGRDDGDADGSVRIFNEGVNFTTTVIDAISKNPLLFIVKNRLASFEEAWAAATNEERKVLIQWLPVVQKQGNL